MREKREREERREKDRREKKRKREKKRERKRGGRKIKREREREKIGDKGLPSSLSRGNISIKALTTSFCRPPRFIVASRSNAETTATDTVCFPRSRLSSIIASRENSFTLGAVVVSD